jgi:hypothetical protein
MNAFPFEALQYYTLGGCWMKATEKTKEISFLAIVSYVANNIIII